MSVKPGPGDRYLLGLLKDVTTPAILALNKVDLIAKARLLPIIDHYRQAHPFVEFVPVSAADGTNVDVLERLFLQYLPEGEPLYPPDYVTDQPERFFVGEIVREQVLQLTHDELPFSTAVVVDRLRGAGEDATYEPLLHDPRRARVPEADRHRQGRRDDQGDRHGGAPELERYFAARVYLDLHVKVKSEWRDDERVLDEMGLKPT